MHATCFAIFMSVTPTWPPANLFMWQMLSLSAMEVNEKQSEVFTMPTWYHKSASRQHKAFITQLNVGSLCV